VKTLGLQSPKNHQNKAMEFFHSGDLGDVLYALPAMRSLGGGNLFLVYPCRA
jgi:hypothetical protein